MIMECNGVLVAMDQHAADERVRLEDLRDRLLAAVAAGAGRSSPARVAAQPVAGHSRHAGTAATARSGCSAAATVAEDSSTIVGTQPGEATAAALRLALAEPAELLSCKTTASSACGGLSDCEWHLYEAYRDHVKRCAECQLQDVRYSKAVMLFDGNALKQASCSQVGLACRTDRQRQFSCCGIATRIWNAADTH